MPPAWCCHKQIGMFLKTMEECRNLVAVAAVVAAVAEAFLLVGAVDFYYVPCSNNRV